MSPAPPQSQAFYEVLAVVGATATGKSDLAVALALRLGGEVVNADSMQLYRGMDIGTAKLGSEQRRGVPHHLLDVWSVREPASVAAYQRMAQAAIDDIASRGAVPVVVGGSGLYVRAALDQLEFPGTDATVRARVEQQLAEVGAAAMHARLAAVDPDAAATIPASNTRRVVRALEVVELTGRPFTAVMPEHRYARPAVQIGLVLSRADLAARITDRVDAMWQQGFVDEVRRLEADGLRDGRTASRALGYAQVLRHLAGEWSDEQARAETVRATRRFSRRQESWFTRDPRVRWITAASTEERAEEVARHLRGVAHLSDPR